MIDSLRGGTRICKSLDKRAVESLAKTIELFGRTGEFAEHNVSVIPDFISNCGMARIFASLMENEVEIIDEAIFADIYNTIKQALEKAHTPNAPKTEIAKASFKIAISPLL